MADSMTFLGAEAMALLAHPTVAPQRLISNMCFTRHYKDTIQERLMILYRFVPNLLEYDCADIIKIDP